jgi:glucose/arabinose dehydrogenase
MQIRALMMVAGALLIGCERAPVADVTGAPVMSDQASFRLVRVTGPLEHPWGMAFLPNGDLLITERPGRLRIVHDGVLDPTPIAGVPEVYASGQGGLLDVALDPDYADNGLIYLSYAARGENGAGTRVARGRLGDGALEDVEVIFEGFMTSGGRHFGSRLGFGNRNPQGLTVHPETGAVWAVEHGPRGGDELNVVTAGTNYGWPVITYGRAYSGLPIGEGTAKEGMAQPVHYWVPSISPSGMVFYHGDAFPQWQGDLFVGALSGDLLARLELDGEQVVEEERLLESVLGRIRDVRLGPDGLLYLLNDQEDGALWRLEPA